MNDATDNWFAVSGGSDLMPGSARAVSLKEKDIVIWRSNQGNVRAWRNQCIHRGMRLSHGQVRGEELTCRYHGWQFDLAGRCTKMPATPDVKPAKTLCVPSYACVEKGGLIWVCLDADDSSALDNRFETGPMQGSWLFGKSLYVDSETSSLQSKLTDVRFPLFSDPSDVTHIRYQCENDYPGVLVVMARNDNEQEKVLIAIQPITNIRTALHCSLLSNGDSDSDQKRLLFLHRWTKRLRWFLQHPGASYDGFNPLPISNLVPEVTA